MESAIDIKQNRQEIADRANEIMKRWKFIPDRKRGRPKYSENIGRPRKIDPATVIKLEEAFAIGCSVNEACAFADITKPTLYAWTDINPEFLDRIKELQANPVVRARKSVYMDMKFNGELALKFLERKVPEEFSLKAIVQHNVEFTGIALDRPKVIEQIVDKSLPVIEQDKP